jgi:phage shock protein PspC (stress-responsive transcriptional regulator)
MSGNRYEPLAARYGLVRPIQGRYVAGVAAALGRATRTDPVLWRVVLAVLVCFLGLGALLYLVVWLLTPEEGDTASPVESLLGRGTSNTSPVVSGLLGLVTIGLLAVILPRPFYVVIGGIVVVALVLLINRAQTSPDPLATPPPGSAFSAPPPPGTPGTPPPGTPWRTGAPGSAPPPAASPVPVPPPVPGGPAPAPPLGPPPGSAATGYRPPFAPHGPFAGPPVPPRPPKPPKPPRERSPLPALVVFGILIALGMVGTVDLTGAVDVPAAAYVASALAVVGGGLLVGAWLGHARILIALGVPLALALPAAHALETYEPPEYAFDEFTWTPTTTTELRDEYRVMFGMGTLNLRSVDLSGEEVDVRVDARFAEMIVIVPPGIAMETSVDCQFGNVELLGGSGGCARETVRDPGSGDPDAGTLRLDLTVMAGNVEVRQ